MSMMAKQLQLKKYINRIEIKTKMQIYLDNTMSSTCFINQSQKLPTAFSFMQFLLFFQRLFDHNNLCLGSKLIENLIEKSPIRRQSSSHRRKFN